MVVVTARRSAFLEGDLPKLKEPQDAIPTSRCSCGPTRCRPTAASRSSTRPAIRCSPARSAAPAPCARWPTTARCASACSSSRKPRRRRIRRATRCAPRSPRAARCLCEWQARPLLAAYGIGDGDREQLAQSAAVAEAVARTIGGPVALKVQSRRHSAQDRSRRGRAQYLRRRRARRLRARARQRQALRAGRAHRRRAGAADGEARPRGHSRHQSRRALGPAADGRAGRRAGRGDGRCRACAGAARPRRRAGAARPPQGRGRARPPIAACRRPTPRRSPS